MGDSEKPFVLVIDDNQQNIQVISAILDQAGYELAISLNAESALKYLENEKPDLILLDVMMPGMDGYELCTILKKDDILKEIPVIFLTAKHSTEDIVKGFDAGGVDYVTKPFRTPELLARIKTHIELKKAKEEIVTLQGIIPICANCKKIRNEEGAWEQMEKYISKHSNALFSHGICIDCARKLYGDQEWITKLEELEKKNKLHE